ncbi:MAG: ATP-dependent DNA helicase RecG [bacterium]|nr:ATP-dependent DNA helicase RecG [bacterium]
MDLKTPVGEGGGIYKKYSSRLKKLGIITFNDFLYHFPFRYEDYSFISTIDKIQAGETVTIKGTVLEIENKYLKNHRTIQRAKISDETGTISVTWFNQPYLTRAIQKNDFVSLSGKITNFQNKPIMESPQYEIINKNGLEQTIHTGRLVPIYPETRGISSKWIRRQIYKILNDQTQNIFEYLPSSIIENIGLTGITDALEQIHFPKTIDKVGAARKRLSFDELFLLHLSVNKRKKEWERNLKSNPFSVVKFEKEIEKLQKELPFELTGAQKRALKEILEDLKFKKPMNRLLEGEVGSGKTVVSAIAMYLAFLNGFQSVIMAPTEILAQQHYKTISNLLSPLKLKIGLSTRNSKLKTKNMKYDILVGTHAVLSEKVNFENLGLVIIDEQQRFGVEQRAIIRKKGKNPHVLTMTATPIPRTVALTLYGDLDLSVLDEMPKGRKNIKTWLVPKEKRDSAYQWITEQLINNKSQAFIVCPFIEESETMQTVKAAAKEFERLKKEVFPKLKLGLLHGRIKAKEKEEVLEKFKKRQIDILVATPVVEVGIDFPNATIMIIEASERFGLSQLHQLRGRVGRGDKQSYCLLFTESDTPKTIERLKAMEKINIGAKLAELDLKLRGAGDMYGTAQHGIKNLKIASFSDFKLIEETKKEAEKIFPKLDKYPLLFEKIKNEFDKEISPD